MEDPIERAVRRAITTMRENLGEQLTVDDMARAAMFSKFHFTRIFQRATGVSPGRFLSALRLQQAKHLLVSTSLNIADISLRVGYNSVGTFSSRFSRSIGMSPTAYRRLAGFANRIPTNPGYRVGNPFTARLYGQVWSASPESLGMVFIGLFPDRIPEGRPVRCTVLNGPGPYRLEAVPPGNWYLLAQSVSPTAMTGRPDGVGPVAVGAGAVGTTVVSGHRQGHVVPGRTTLAGPGHAGATHPTAGGRLGHVCLLNGVDGPDAGICVATHALNIRDDEAIKVDVYLKPARMLDPPVLLALLDARKLAMARMGASEVSRLQAAGRSAA